jgi:hypothetical protein
MHRIMELGYKKYYSPIFRVPETEFKTEKTL